MSYVTTVGGVALEISTQAARPREAPRPSPAASSASPEMASRAARPRETTGVNKVEANRYLAEVIALRGKQAALEKMLKNLGAQLTSVNGQILKCQKSGGNCTGLVKQKEQIERAAALCIEEIKKLSAKANASADAAIAKGATREQTLRASATGTSSTQPAATAVESSKAGVTPNGTIVVSRDARPVDAPLVEAPRSGPGDIDVKPADIVVSDGTVGVGLGTVAVVGVLGFLGYRMAKKKGWL